MKYALLFVSALVFAIAGFIVGRSYAAHTAHHYERWRDRPYLLDTSTGRVCNPFRDAQDKVTAANATMDTAVVAANPIKSAPSASSNRDTYRDMARNGATSDEILAEFTRQAKQDGWLPVSEKHVRVEDMIPACASE